MVLKGVVAPRTEHEKAYLSYRMNLDEQHQLEVAAKANKKRASKTRSSNMRERNAQKLGTSLSDKHARIESDLEDQRGRFRVRKIPQINAPRRGLGKKANVRKTTSAGLSQGGQVVPRLIGDTWVFVDAYSRSYILKNADERRAKPTRAEAELQRFLNLLNGGVLQGRFRREHVVSGKWIVDFFFPEIRLAIEVDGPIHDTQSQQSKDRIKDADCEQFDIAILRLRNSEIFRDRRRLVEKLRASWRAAIHRENRIIGKLG